MSRCYVMNESPLEAVKAGHMLELKHEHRPTMEDGKPSLWPDAIVEGENYGWLEGNMILFWGSSNETPMLRILANNGYIVQESF